MEALHNFFLKKKESIILFESGAYAERAAKFTMRESCEIRTRVIHQNDGTVDHQNGGIP